MLLRRCRVPSLGALCLVSVVSTPAAAQHLLGDDRTRLPAGLAAAVDAVLVDLDGDGLADIARAVDDGVQILLQRPGGRFEPHPVRPNLPLPGRGLRSVSTASLRPGGRLPDLIVVPTSGAPELFWNDGTGAFGPAPALPAPVAPVARVVPFDADRVPPEDLLLVPELGRLQVLLGRLDGSYVDAPSWVNANLVLQAPRVAFLDVDGDGDGDLVVVSPQQAAPFVLERGPAGFQQQRALPLRGGHSALAVGDFDGDAREDLVLARATPLPAALEIVRFPASGPVVHVLPVPFGLDTPARALAAADLGGNAAADVVVLQTDGRVRVGLNDGLPQFGLTQIAVPVSPAPRSAMALADADGDGDLDLHVAGGAAGSVAVRDSFLLARGRGGRFVDTESVAFPIAATAFSAAAGAAVDLDGDGDPDLVAFGAGRGVAYLDPTGSARFVERANVFAPVGVQGITRVERVGIDTPGRDVLVVADAASGSAAPPGLRLFVAQGGSYADVSARLPTVAWQGLLDVAPVRAILANGLPRPVHDLVLADAIQGLVFLANSAGGFQVMPGAFAPALPTDPVFRILAGDLDGDRRDDVVVLTHGPRGLVAHVYLRGSTNVAPLFAGTSFAVASTWVVPSSATLGDADGDGDPDVLVAGASATSRPLTLFRNDGRGRLNDASAQLPANLPANADHVAILGARVQPPVLLLATGNGDGVWRIVADGQGGFLPAAPQPVPGSRHVRGLVVADFDTDGDDDCVILAHGVAPSLLLGGATQLSQAALANAGQILHMRMRGPSAAALGAWLWSPAGPARVVTADWGILRLAPPLTSLAVFPFGPTRTQDIRFPAPASAVDVVLHFQLAVFDPGTGSLRLSNAEPTTLVAN